MHTTLLSFPECDIYQTSCENLETPKTQQSKKFSSVSQPRTRSHTQPKKTKKLSIYQLKIFHFVLIVLEKKNVTDQLIKIRDV